MVKQINNDVELAILLSEAGNKLVVVDFTATWCSPCRHFAPFFEKLSKENEENVIFVKVDVDASGVSSARDISHIPTFQFYKGGQKVHEFYGADQMKVQDIVKELK